MADSKHEYQNIAFGTRMRIARNAAKLTQEKLAEKMGLSVQFISDLERGVVGPSVQTLIKLTDVLHVSCDHLLFGDQRSSFLSSYFNQILRLPEEEQELIMNQLLLLEEAIKYTPKK